MHHFQLAVCSNNVSNLYRFPTSEILQLYSVCTWTIMASFDRPHDLLLVFRPNLWPLYVIGQAIYIFILSFVLFSFFFFPRLFSAFADWMSTILAHMVWPSCEFKMQVWNVLHGVRSKYRTQKVVRKSRSGHHRTTLSGYIFATKALIDYRKKAC